MYSFEQLDRETARLHQLLKMIQANKYKADTVWNNFCMEMNKGDRKPQKKFFKKHPKTLSESSSEILSPRPKTSCLIRKNLNTVKSANNIKFAEPINNDDEDAIETGSIPSVEVVTIRREYPLKRTSKSKCVNVDITKSKDINRKTSKANKSSHDSIANKKSSKELETIISGKLKEEIEKCNFEAKLQGTVEKCLNCMEDIRVQLDIGITPPDGLDDLERRKKRSSEFASRFSRNYLYQLNRQLSDLKKLLYPTSGRSSHQNNSLVKQKITSSYQTILQGLQAYSTHLPISIPIGVPDKIKELLKEVSTLCELQRSYASTDVNSNVKSNELLDIFEVRSRCLIEKIDDYYSTASVISLLQSQSKFSLLEQSKARKKNNIKSRYSMYTGMPTRKDAHWKRAAASLARKKYNVQSKYKTAYFKHRPPIEKQPVVKPIIKTKLIEKKSSTSIKMKPTIDDDNIKTLIEMEKEKTQKSAVKDGGHTEIIGDNLVPLIEKLVDKLKEENKEMTQEHIRRLLQANDEHVITELASRLVSQDACQKYGCKGVTSEEDLVSRLLDVIKKHSKEKTCQKCEKNDLEIGENAKRVAKKNKRERKKTVTVTGVKNAQLICIKDEGSIIESPNHSPPSESRQIRSHSAPHPVRFEVKAQNDCHKAKKKGGNSPAKDCVLQRSTSNDAICKQPCCQERPLSSKEERRSPRSEYAISSVSNTGMEPASRIKISRLPKVPLHPLKMLPKKFALNILEYKVNYLKARKGDHMYKKSAIKQPWILMGEISDKILEELLQAIGTEIEVNDVIEGIFASEFV